MNCLVAGNIAKGIVLKNAIKKLIPISKELGIDLSFDANLKNFVDKKYFNTKLKYQFVIAIGGDGTILSVAQKVINSKVPILGLNIGKLGFLTESTIDSIKLVFQNLIAGKYFLDKRSLLEIKIKKNKKTFYALNEVVIDKGNSSRMISVETFVEKEALLTFNGDGVIVTTPTGSTGYSLATGGPIISPSAPVIGITPISAHMLTARPVILQDDKKIKIKVTSKFKKARLVVDGNQEVVLNSSDTIEIKKSKYSINLVRQNSWSFYDLLRKKLLWGFDLRIISK
ncbi:MAG: NAD(+)/NADH kinase [Bacteroidetes bacterium]|nr:NAD(+)/NADH kinase [Bacteroidota bacterium]